MKKILSVFAAICIFASMSTVSFAATEGGYSYTVPDGLATIIGYDHTLSGDIRIPDTIGGAPIVGVSDGAFKNCNEITGVDIPVGIESIGESAFENCRNLKNISITYTVKEIGRCAFEGTQYYNTPENWEDGVLYIGKHLIKAKTAPAIYRVKDETLTLAKSSFANCTTVKSVILPGSMKNISDNAFYGCSNLESIEIPAEVKSINKSAFENCNNLKDVCYLGTKEQWEKITIGSNNGPLTRAKIHYGTPIEDVMYTYTTENGAATITKCEQLLAGVITVPKTLDGYPVTSIADKAFENCINITKIVLPDGITNIGKSAFSGCQSLENIEIQDGLKTLGDEAFYFCQSLKSIKIPSGITSIGNSVFRGCTALEKAELPATVTEINSNAFAGCESLLSIELPSSLVSIGEGAFGDCRSLKNIKIPGSVTTIYHSAFAGCESLEKAEMPGKVTYLGCDVFYGTKFYNNSANWQNGVLYAGNHLIAAKKDLSGICNIKSAVVTIADGAFSECKALVGAIMPDSLVYIGNYAFNECSNLKSVTIPGSVTSIGDGAFYKCTNLESVAISGRVSNIGISAFEGTSYYNNAANLENGVLYIGNHLIRANNSIPQNYTIKEGTVTIADSAFAYCTVLRSIEIPRTVTAIGDNAFEKCTNLKKVGIPSSVTSMGNWVFYGCTGLESIEMPNGLSKIGTGVFMNCENLRRVGMPDGITSIGASAFANCAHLTNIEIPSGVTKIDDDAFLNCVGLEVEYAGVKSKWNEIDISPIGNDRLFYINIQAQAQITNFTKTVSGSDVKVNVEVTGVRNGDFVFVAAYGNNNRLLEIKKITLYDGKGEVTFPSKTAIKFKAIVMRQQLGKTNES